MQTYHLQPIPTGLQKTASYSNDKPPASVYPLYPDLIPYQRLEHAINHASEILDANGFSLLADELCDSFNQIPL